MLVCGGFLLVAAAIVLVIVPPVCTTLGCPPKSDDGSAISPEEQLVGVHAQCCVVPACGGYRMGMQKVLGDG
jgi:hypothetical protein